MKRRDSLKYIAATALATTAIATGCKPSVKTDDAKSGEAAKPGVHRYEDEELHEEAVKKMPAFFNAHELATLTLLTDIIIPKDEVSGSASDAKVVDFIAFTVNDQPDEFQIPLRGGLRWLDMFCLKKFGKAFKDLSQGQQIEVVDLIAYPEKAKNNKELAQGVAFFNTVRDLTVTGFYTSEIGVKDLGYTGNRPNQWNGVPDEVLKQYGLSYSEKELKECLSFDTPTPISS